MWVTLAAAQAALGLLATAAVPMAFVVGGGAAANSAFFAGTAVSVAALFPVLARADDVRAVARALCAVRAAAAAAHAVAALCGCAAAVVATRAAWGATMCSLPLHYAWQARVGPAPLLARTHAALRLGGGVGTLAGAALATSRLPVAALDAAQVAADAAIAVALGRVPLAVPRREAEAQRCPRVTLAVAACVAGVAATGTTLEAALFPFVREALGASAAAYLWTTAAVALASCAGGFLAGAAPGPTVARAALAVTAAGAALAVTAAASVGAVLVCGGSSAAHSLALVVLAQACTPAQLPRALWAVESAAQAARVLGSLACAALLAGPRAPLAAAVLGAGSVAVTLPLAVSVERAPPALL